MNRLAFRGQVGIELIVGVALIIAIFFAVIIIASDLTAESAAIKTNLDASRVGESIRDNINMIAQQGPGYYRYFSIPEEIHGGYVYDVAIRGNVVDLAWSDGSWSTKIIASNITVHCLSKGETVRNRVYYGDSGIEVACHLPNIKVLGRTMVVDVVGNTSRVDITNDAHVGTAQFRTRFNTTDNETSVYMAFEPYETRTVWYNTSFSGFVGVYADMDDTVNESVESDNSLTVTI